MEGQDDFEDDTAQVDCKQVSSQITGDKNVIFVNSHLTVNNFIGAEYGHMTPTLGVEEVDAGSNDVNSEGVNSENEAPMVTNGSGDGIAQNFSRLLAFTTSAAISNGHISRWKGKIEKLTASGTKKMRVECDQVLYYCRESEIAAGSDGAHVFVGIFGGKPVAIKRCVLYSVREKDKLVTRSLLGKPLAHVLIPDRIIEDDHFIYYVSKLCAWNVREVIEEASNPLRSVLNPVRRQQMCAELLEGLRELQVDFKILHRDLKPSNVLLDHKGKVLISDFGVSRLLIDKTLTVTEGVGSMCWMAKEVLKSPGLDVNYTMSADIQVAGFLVYYILTDGHIPHESTYPYKRDTAKVIENIRKDKYSLRHLKEHDVFESLLEDMINPVAEHRPSISECLSRFQSGMAAGSQQNPANQRVPDRRAASGDSSQHSRSPEAEEPLNGTHTGAHHEPTSPWTMVQEHLTTPTNLTPEDPGGALDEVDGQPTYEPSLPHQSHAVPYPVGSATLMEEYVGSRRNRVSGEEDCSSLTTGEMGSAPFLPRVIQDITTKEGQPHGKEEDRSSPTPGEMGSAPFFPRVIRDITTKEGRLVTFDCIVKGNPDISWLKDGIEITSSREAIMKYGAGNSCTLQLSLVRLDKAGKYTCKAINRFGVAQCSAVLTVTADRRFHEISGLQVPMDTADSPVQTRPPKFIQAPKDTTVVEGKLCQVSCQIEGVPPPTVTWHYQGKPLGRAACYFERDGQMHTLRLDKIRLNDEGFYSCMAVNSRGQAEKTFTIKVKEAGKPPKFLEPLLETVVGYGTPVSLKCTVRGTQPMYVTWEKFDNHMPLGSLYHMAYDQSTGECVLGIDFVSRNDEGEFLCRAENKVGCAETTAELIVGGPGTLEPIPYAPKMTASLSDVEVTEGDPWELKCSITAHPRPTLTWYKDDKPLVVETPAQALYRGRTAKLLAPAGTTTDAGRYSVRAVNPQGEVITSSYLRVKERQIPPSASSSSKILTIADRVALYKDNLPSSEAS